MKESSVRRKTGNVIVVNTRESVTEVLSVINVVLKLPFHEYVGKDSVTFSLLLLLHTCGISKAHQVLYHFFLTFSKRVLKQLFTTHHISSPKLTKTRKKQHSKSLSAPLIREKRA